MGRGQRGSEFIFFLLGQRANEYMYVDGRTMQELRLTDVLELESQSEKAPIDGAPRVTMIEGGHFSLSLLSTGEADLAFLHDPSLPLSLLPSFPNHSPSPIMRYRMTICFIRRRQRGGRHRRPLRNYRHQSN